MISPAADLADLPARLGPPLAITAAPPAPARRSRWEDRELTEATYTPEVAARVEQIQREEQLKTSLASAASLPSSPVTITPVDSVTAPVIKFEDAKLRSRIETPQSELPFEETKELVLAQIQVDPSIQMRAQIDATVVEEYAESMSSGIKFPPVIVFAEGETYRLADGFHRVEAAKLAGLEKITAEVKSGGKLEALRYALGANVRHGLRRTNVDKRRAVEIALKEFAPLSDRAIAEICGVGNALVSEFRKQVCDSNTSSSRKGRDGKSYPSAKSALNKHLTQLAPAAGHPLVPEPNTASLELLPVSTQQEELTDSSNHALEAAPAVDVNRSWDTDARIERENPPVAPVAASSKLSSSEPETSAPLAFSTDTPAAVVERPRVADVEFPADEGADPISDEKVARAVGLVHARDFGSSDSPDLAVHVRQMVPQVAAILNQYAREFPGIEGHDLCRALGMANTKIQASMKWV